MIGARWQWFTPRFALATGISLVGLVFATGRWPATVEARHASRALPLIAAKAAPLVPPGTPRDSVDAQQHGPLTLASTTVQPERHPLDGLSVAELVKLARTAPERLGCATLGRPNRGRLLNGVPLSSSERIRVVDAKTSFGTEETVRSIEQAVDEVWRQFPSTPELAVGDLSRARGGYLRPHRSHQSGLDADLAYYYLGEQRWYTKATAENLDRARTWALLKALVARGNVEYVFIDREVQGWLLDHARSIGEPEELLSELFETPPRRDTLVRHVPRHRTHLHVRFVDPAAEKTARRLRPIQHLLRI